MIYKTDKLKKLKDIPCPMACADNKFSKCVDLIKLRKEALKHATFHYKKSKKINSRQAVLDMHKGVLEHLQFFYGFTNKEVKGLG